MSGPRMLSAGPLGAVDCGVGTLWIRFICPVRPMGARLYWDLERLQAGLATLGSLPPVPHVLRTAVHCVFWCLLSLPALTFFSDLSCISFSLGSQRTGWPLAPTGRSKLGVPVILSPVY